MVDRSAEHWYPTAAYLYVLHLDDLGTAWEYLRRNPITGSTGCAIIAGRKPRSRRRIAGACACWKIRRWMRATRIQPGCPAMWPWCSSIPTPIRRSMLPRSRFGALPGTSNCSMTAKGWR